MPTRRAFLATLAATGSLPALGWADAGSPAWLSCAREADGGFALFGLRADGALAFRQPLPTRGHAGARHPLRPEAVIFARRPGAWALVLDAATGAVAARLAPPAGHQFNGHGAFLQGGALLVTSEQLAETSEGRLGLWAADEGYQRIGDLPSGGIGPHEIRALADGTLVIANGGIATDPTDRTKLNIPDMRPNLAFADAEGRLRAVLEPAPEARQASIRHLAELPDGRIAAAMQWEGEGPPPPLLALARPDGGLAPVAAPEALWPALQGYIGSVAAAGDRIAISSPRGGRMAALATDGRLLVDLARADACGLAAAGAGAFLVTDGSGALFRVGDGPPLLLARHPCAWDNHVVPVG
ncbi:MAG: DUF1513 domain-containing protein [Rhodobacteraceae bacterium]|nr:DUF1513 domain-containing protein [Paracoccaceae bacterium]